MVYLTFSTIVFTLALSLTEVSDSRSDDLTTHYISDYFSTATRLVQDAGFLLMASALWYVAYAACTGWTAVSFALVGVGLAGAMATDTWPRIFFGLARYIHYGAAALCFLAGLGAMLVAGDYTYAAAYTLSAALLAGIDPHHMAVQEKVGVLMLTIWVFGYSLGR